MKFNQYSTLKGKIMGQQLLKYYKEAEKMGGIMGKMKLAMYTLIPSTEAGSTPDTPENIKKFNEAMVKVKQDLGK